MVTSQIEGTEVFESLRGAFDRSRRELAGSQSQASQLDEELRGLLARRGETLLQLARHYLPDMSRTTIQQTFEEIRNDLLTILARREARQRDVRGELEQTRKTIEARTNKLDDVTARLNEKVAQRERLEVQVADILKGNEEFQKRSVLALQAEEKLHRNEQRATEIASEAATKLPHYENSRLFRYLLERGYGTADYKSTGWTRSIDSWVARMIDFANARNGFDYLKKTPALVAEEVSRRRDQFTQLMQQVEAIQKTEADRQGLTTVLEEGDKLGTERDQLVAELEALHTQVQNTQKTLAELDQTQNQFYNEAVEKLRSFLGETRLAILENRARTTPEPQDDALVSDLARLAYESESLQKQLGELNEQRSILDRQQEGLDLLIRRYQQANYDSQRSYFDGRFDVQESLGQFQAGQMDSNQLWSSIQSAQHFRPHWVESTTQTGSQVIVSPSGRVLMGSLIEIASQALQQAAIRGVQRRGDVFGPSSFPMNIPSQSPSSYEAPSSPSPPSYSSGEGSFTSGEGF